MELFSLVDYDIPGYQLPQSISELHLSLENCAVEYRPVLLPHHVLLFCESVHVTSNAIPEAVGYKLKSEKIPFVDFQSLFVPGFADVDDFVCLFWAVLLAFLGLLVT